jgi:endo-1,4-beta-xylanase
VSVNPLGKNITTTSQLFAEQADYTAKIVLQYKKIAYHLQYGITIWGISDKSSWIRPYFNREDYPLLYDDNYVPKPIYCKLFDVL